MNRWRKINTVICFMIVFISITTILLGIFKTALHEQKISMLWNHLDDNYPEVMKSEIGDDVVVQFLKNMWVGTSVSRDLLTLSLVLIIVLCAVSLTIRFKCSKRMSEEKKILN